MVCACQWRSLDERRRIERSPICIPRRDTKQKKKNTRQPRGQRNCRALIDFGLAGAGPRVAFKVSIRAPLLTLTQHEIQRSNWTSARRQNSFDHSEKRTFYYVSSLKTQLGTNALDAGPSHWMALKTKTSYFLPFGDGVRPKDPWKRVCW